MTKTLKHAFFVPACLLGLVTLLAFSPGRAAADETCPALLNYEFKRLQDEAPQNLCQYAGKVTLIINTASYCGYTSQYDGLEKLYARYKDKGLVILGFPSNDFSQEPGNNKEIADFCYNTYGVKFPMFAKSSVKGKEMNPLFANLTKTSGKAPGWNFHKYLLDRNGNFVTTYNSQVGPDNKNLVAAIEKALTAK